MPNPLRRRVLRALALLCSASGLGALAAGPASPAAAAPAGSAAAAGPPAGAASAPSTASTTLVPLTARDVRVSHQGAGFSVDVLMHAPVPPALAFAVLTDFEHMAQFIPDLHSSQVQERQGAVLVVAQQGTARWGPVSIPFEAVRELRLSPPLEIRSHLLRGSMKRLDSLMQLEEVPGGTLLRYHAEGEPGQWFPPVVGPALVRQETADQFNAMLREMQRRR